MSNTSKKLLTPTRNESQGSSPQINLLMKTIIAIYLLLGAVGSGVRASKQTELPLKLAAVGSIILHLWFGVWMLTNP
jgi:hypothetical protein